MAKASAFKQDGDAIENGEWTSLGEEFDDVEVLTRGFTDAYFDAQATKQRKAARGFGGDVDKLPNALRRKINTECLIKHVLVAPGVRNLVNDDDSPVTFEQFCEMLESPDYRTMLHGCFRAAGQVGQLRTADLEDAAKN